MHRMLSVKIKDMNSYLKCPLCKGYLIDSFTINECLHSFCKSCIVKYVKRKECCPVCKITILKDKIGLFLKRDVNLQYVVYKLVPGLFKNEMRRRRKFYSTHPKAIKYLKKKKIFDKESIGELDENIFILDNYTDISLSIEYSETGIPEICDSYRTKEINPSNPKSYLQCPATFTIDLLKKFLLLKLGLKTISNLDIMYDDKPLNKEFTLMDIAYIYAWRRTAPMRLFYRINDPAKSLTNAKPIESTSEQTQLNDQGSNEINENHDKDDHDEPIKPLIKSNESQLEIEPNLPNEPLVKQETSILTNIENKLSTFKDDSHTTSQNELNNKENEDLNNSVNHTTTSNQTYNNTNHNTSNANDNLTITAMVASITKEKKIQISKPAVSNTLLPNIQPAQLQPKLSICQSNETVSNSDKENEDANSNFSNQKQQNETKKLLTNASNLINNSSKLVDSSINVFVQQNNENTDSQNLNNELKPIDLTLNNNHNSNPVSSILEAANGLSDKIKSLPNIKPKPPKKQYNKTKKELLPKLDTNSNVQKSDDTIQIQSVNENASKKTKKSSNPKQACDKPKNPKKPKNQQDVTVKKEATLNNTQESLLLKQHQQQALLAQFQQQHNQQNFFQQHQLSTGFTLPFASKLNSQNGANISQVSAPAASSTPAPSPLLPNNFQLMPMSSLMNSLYPWKQFEGYTNNIAAINGANSNQMTNALINQKYANSIFDYFQSKAQSFQQQQQHQANFLNNSNAAQNQFYQQYLQNSSNATNGLNPNNYPSHQNNYLEEFKKPLANFASFIQDSSYYNQNKSIEKASSAANNNNNNQHHNSALNGLHNNTYSGGDLSSNNSSCGSENSGLDSLKETQLRISESCNLVNDL